MTMAGKPCPRCGGETWEVKGEKSLGHGEAIDLLKELEARDRRFAEFEAYMRERDEARAADLVEEFLADLGFRD